MGCCCAKGIPPPDARLLGTWVNNPHAVDLRTGSGAHRNKRGINLAFRRKNIPQDAPREWIRLIVEPHNIEFAQINVHSGRYVLLDAPVLRWQDHRVKVACCGGEHIYALEQQEEKGLILLFDGHELTKWNGESR